MRNHLLLILITVLSWQVAAQDDVRGKQAEQVRGIVKPFSHKRTRVNVLTRGLVVKKGKVVLSLDDSFDLRVRRGVVTTISYADVLELEGGGQSVSFIPDRVARDHGTWEDVGRIYPGTKILVVYPNGKLTRGFSNSVTATHLIMIDHNGRERVEIQRDKILAVYGLIGGYGGVKKGASQGAGAFKSGRDTLLGGVFVGIGALMGLAKSDGTPILIYSK